jgi:hypothetical protein
VEDIRSRSLGRMGRIVDILSGGMGEGSMARGGVVFGGESRDGDYAAGVRTRLKLPCGEVPVR